MARKTTLCDCGKHCWIDLTSGLVALADAHYAPALGVWSWSAKRDGKRYYAVRTHTEKTNGQRRWVTIRMHHVVLPAFSFLVDHKNGNGLDNRKSNLRLATHSENAQNSRHRKHTSSQYRGVSVRNGLWTALITQRGQQFYLGQFHSEEEAAKAYDAAALRMHGQFASLNFANAEAA